ncbi:transcription elongation factor TFIIS [Citrus sinensis]|uniref:Transcription elongation factor TFIIS n=2 Tax=Citrus sinensis TaxID=2711 RepID=A0ACB8LU88_CITSI|nr:transcription elongation factor TFIIS [Citrus sinensis]KAH9776824.1 transcription elongation factor TFIIS [Citrus sinensis]
MEIKEEVEEKAMEKKVMQLCEEAKRGAEAAVMAEGEAEKAWTAWCIDALDQLNKSDITCPLLVSTQLVRYLLPLTEHPTKKIQDFASDLIVSWRDMFLEQIRDEKKGSCTIPGDTEPAKIEKVDKRTSEECQEISGVGIVKVQKVDQNSTSSSSNVVRSEIVETEETNSADNVNVGNSITEEGEASGIILHKLSSSKIRCNDCFREVVREKVCDALSKVSGEADEEIRDEVNACDSVRVAIALESAMFEKWGRSDGPYKIKYRAVLGNLKDPKNPDFRRKVLFGQVKPETVVGMTAKEMASDEMLRSYQHEDEERARLWKEHTRKYMQRM